MDHNERKRLEYALEMVDIQISEYRKLAKFGPVLLLLVVVVIGILSRAWWSAILYVIVLIVYLPLWIKNIAVLEEAKQEMETCLVREKLELSERSLKVYQDNQVSLGANLFGIISLGIITATCCVLGVIVMQAAFYGTLDVPSLIVGMFLVLLGLVAFVPVLKWIVMLPKTVRMKQDAGSDDQQTDKGTDNEKDSKYRWGERT